MIICEFLTNFHFCHWIFSNKALLCPKILRRTNRTRLIKCFQVSKKSDFTETRNCIIEDLWVIRNRVQWAKHFHTEISIWSYNWSTSELCLFAHLKSCKCFSNKSLINSGKSHFVGFEAAIIPFAFNWAFQLYLTFFIFIMNGFSVKCAVQK